MKRVCFALLAAGCLMLGAGPGHASVTALSSPIISVGCADNSSIPNFVPGVASCGLGGAASLIDLLPAVQLTASSGSSGGNAVSSSGGATYFFEVLGPAVTQVPIEIDTFLGTVMVGQAGAGASITVNTVPFNLISPEFNVRQNVCQNSASPCGGDPAEFSGALHVTAVSNIQAQVSLSVLSGAANGGFASATADPMIFIDPSFPDANQFTLVISSGVGNVLPSVPEPTTWAMLLLGFCGLGAALRMRRFAVA